MYDAARPAGLSIVRDLLGIEPGVRALLAVAEPVLGRERLAACVAWVRAAPLTRRRDNLAAVAALVVAVRSVGDRWWPAAAPSPLDELEHRASAAAADRLWGPPVAEVDLNGLATSDRVSWGWGVASRVGPHRFDDEVPGTSSDPYAVPLDVAAADAVRAWGRSLGVDVSRPWTCAGDVIALLDAVDDVSWWRTASALADGDLASVEQWLRARR